MCHRRSVAVEALGSREGASEVAEGAVDHVVVGGGAAAAGGGMMEGGSGVGATWPSAQDSALAVAA